MRIVIPVAVLAAAGIFLLLWWSDDSGRRRTTPTTDGDPAPGDNGSGTTTMDELPDIDHLARTKPDDVATESEFDRFVNLCAARGADAVPELLRLLEKTDDVRLAPRWQVENGAPVGYPSLRAIYLKALAAIDAPEATEALRSVLETTESAGESLIAARALASRGETGWTAPLLEQADRNAVPVDQPLLMAMVELAVRTDPEQTAAQIARNAPRGDDGADPRTLSYGITLLPLETASRTTRELLAADEVTDLAKARYVRALVRRGEIDALRRLREAAFDDEWGDATRTEAAHAAAGSTAFFDDARTYQAALAAGDTSKADAARSRFEERMHATRSLIEAALDIRDLDTSDHPRAEILRKRLADQEKLLGRR